MLTLAASNILKYLEASLSIGFILWAVFQVDFIVVLL